MLHRTAQIAQAIDNKDARRCDCYPEEDECEAEEQHHDLQACADAEVELVDHNQSCTGYQNVENDTEAGNVKDKEHSQYWPIRDGRHGIGDTKTAQEEDPEQRDAMAESLGAAVKKSFLEEKAIQKDNFQKTDEPK